MIETKLIGKKVTLRNLNIADLTLLWKLRYTEENPEWKKWDAPSQPFYLMDLDQFLELEKKNLQKDEEKGVHSQMLIEVKGIVIGSIIYYWEHEPSRWLEMGITIYNAQSWNGGYGTEAIAMYLDYLFTEMDIERVGITTWSGNERMMAVAEKVGMKLEGRMRKCQFYNGEYYDSIRMGIIREEWNAMKRHQ